MSTDMSVELAGGFDTMSAAYSAARDVMGDICAAMERLGYPGEGETVLGGTIQGYPYRWTFTPNDSKGGSYRWVQIVDSAKNCGSIVFPLGVDGPAGNANDHEDACE